MESVLSMPIFGILVTIACYMTGLLARKFIPSVAIPAVVANVLIILIIVYSPLSLEQYMVGGRIITMFIGPVTVILALKIYNQRAQLKANIIPILGGCAAGSLASLFSTWFLCKLFDLDRVITMSILPKSVTSAIAMELSIRSGGLGDLAISAVIVTGVLSAAFSPLLIKVFKLKDPVAAGVAIGSSGHAIGTATAIQLGETQGALSGLSMCIMGIITSVFWILVF
jgi:putative effector of murein hydrolase